MSTALALLEDDSVILDDFATRHPSTGRTIEGVRDDLIELRRKTDPVDIMGSSRSWPLHMGENNELYIVGTGDREGSFRLTHGAVRQLSQRYGLHSHFLPTLSGLGKEDRAFGPNERSYANSTAMLLVGVINRLRQDTRMLYRTIVLPSGERVVRAALTAGYTPYDNIDFVTMLLDAVPNMLVTSLRSTDNGFSMKAMDIPANRDDIDLDSYYPSIGFRNSETGHAACKVHSAAFRFSCTNGMGYESQRECVTLRHTGNVERIKDQVDMRLGEIRVRASGIPEAYDRAVNDAINDALAWFTDGWAPNSPLTGKEIRLIQENWHDPTNGPDNTRARVIDAITLTARDMPNLERARITENAARRLLEA